MPGHHGRRRPAVGHARGELVDAVAAGRVAHDVNAVGVHLAEDEGVLQQPVEQDVDVRLVPQVPVVGRVRGAT